MSLTPEQIAARDEKMAILRGLAKSENAKRQKTNPGAPDAMFFIGDKPELKARRYLSTGNPALDRALGGGWRLGVPVEIAGSEGSSKTTHSLMAAAEGIRVGETVLFISTEQSVLPIDQCDAAGLTEEERDQIIFVPAFGAGENLFNSLRALLYDPKTSAPRYLLDVIIIDSLAALVPQAEVDSIEKNGFEGATVGRHAVMVGKFYRFVCNVLHPEGILITVNQMRKQIGQTPLPDITTGGNATKYFNKVRVVLKPDNEETKKMVLAEKGKDPVQLGKAIRFEVVKNNMGMPHRKGTFRYYFGKGLDIITPVFDEALDIGIVFKTSPTSPQYNIPLADGTIKKIVGADSARAFFEEESVYAYIRSLVEKSRDEGAADTALDVTSPDVAVDEATGEIVELGRFLPGSDTLAGAADLEVLPEAA